MNEVLKLQKGDTFIQVPCDLEGIEMVIEFLEWFKKRQISCNNGEGAKSQEKASRFEVGDKLSMNHNLAQEGQNTDTLANDSTSRRNPSLASKDSCNKTERKQP